MIFLFGAIWPLCFYEPSWGKARQQIHFIINTIVHIRATAFGAGHLGQSFIIISED